MTGGIPAGLGGLAKLERLNVENNRLAGVVPPQVCALDLIETCDAAGNDGLCGCAGSRCFPRGAAARGCGKATRKAARRAWLAVAGAAAVAAVALAAAAAFVFGRGERRRGDDYEALSSLELGGGAGADDATVEDVVEVARFASECERARAPAPERGGGRVATPGARAGSRGSRSSCAPATRRAPCASGPRARRRPASGGPGG